MRHTTFKIVLAGAALLIATTASAPLSSRVAHAAWLDQMELKDEARKYWRALATERADDARLRALAAQQYSHRE